MFTGRAQNLSQIRRLIGEPQTMRRCRARCSADLMENTQFATTLIDQIQLVYAHTHIHTHGCSIFYYPISGPNSKKCIKQNLASIESPPGFGKTQAEKRLKFECSPSSACLGSHTHKFLAVCLFTESRPSNCRTHRALSFQSGHQLVLQDGPTSSSDLLHEETIRIKLSMEVLKFYGYTIAVVITSIGTPLIIK
ncbi:hypothetical protein L1887_62310 [Cichorium endivia]|nr:hypothetical protein L1887_62310 [Cichorium endivia]